MGVRLEPLVVQEGLQAGLGPREASMDDLVERLSGRQQRVAVARALADDPRLRCLHDTTSELDPASGAAVVLVGLPELEPPAHADTVLDPT